MILVDGTESDTLDVRDRGLQYGDGLFETLAVRDGEPRRWAYHLERLQAGCRRLAIPAPTETNLTDEAERCCTGVERGVLKVLVTRGSGGRGYRPPAEPHPRRLLMAAPWPDYPDAHWTEGVRLRYCDTPLGESPALAGLKHLNRLEQVLARAEWDDPAIAEGLMRDPAGRVVDGTQSNLFWVRDGVLHTPALMRCGVSGVARRLVLEHAEVHGIPFSVDDETYPADLDAADELFVTNSVIGLWPVRELAGRTYRPGPLAQRMAAALDEG